MNQHISSENERKIAYFSMEIGLEASIPTYSGGLGVLAGDTIRSAADSKVPMVAVTLLHRKGYFYQRLDATGRQNEEDVAWAVDDFLQEMPARTAVALEGRTVTLRAWKYEVKGFSGFTVPIYFLDTNLPENSEWDRTLTDSLYSGDSHFRFCQEVILGMGGCRILGSLGHENLQRYHMNEGHASLLTLELLNEQVQQNGRDSITDEDLQAVREKCVFTTHTPVAAGHDQFPMDLVTRVLGEQETSDMKHIFRCEEALGKTELKNLFCFGDALNMTYLALNLSHYVNGVAKKHGEVSQHMFAPYIIDSITNGVHVASKVCPPFQELFDRYIPGWREDNFSLRYALNIPLPEVWQAHMAVKQRLIQFVNHETNVGMDLDTLTLGFARRATSYKRADLLFYDMKRLMAIAETAGPFQVIFAGKAHPQDQKGKQLIQRIFQAKEQLKQHIKIAYLSNYDIDLSKRMTAGVDVWLNTPQQPMEASGTSGMKAALNGVPSLSILDGWWIEGCIENLTGWAIGTDHKKTGELQTDATAAQDSEKDARSLYDKLEQVVIPNYYHNRDHFMNIMLHCIALNGSFFNTQRMMQQYVLKAYFR